jgi:hypothetical protein
MKFEKEFLLELDEEIVQKRMVSQSRWSTTFEEVFKIGDKFFRTSYSVGSTESVDKQAYDEFKDDEQIECEEVVPVEVVKTVYILANDGS